MTPAEKVELLRAACCVAGADQDASSEHAVLKKMADEIGVGKASLQAMINRSESDPDFHKQQFQILKAEPKQAMAVLLEVALADGQIVDSEIGVLQRLAFNLGIEEQIVAELIDRARTHGTS